MSKKYQDISFTWEGDITSISGWAKHARGILRPLIEGGASVRLSMLSPSRPEVRVSKWWETQFEKLPKNPAGMIKVNHGGVSNISRNPTGGPVVLLGHWETADVPGQWVTNINQHFDELWLPNEHLITAKTKEVIKIPIKVVPCPVDYDTINRSSEVASISPVSPTHVVFGTVGQWNQRRNLSDLIVAYLSEFSKSDQVALIIKTFGNAPGNPNDKMRIVQLVRELKNSVGKAGAPEIILIQDILSEAAFYSLIRRFTIYVSTSRGESKDITMGLCAALGKQCVYIDSHAHKTYTSMDNGLFYPINYCQEPVIQMNQVYSCSDKWVRPDVSAFAQGMRDAYIDFLTKDDLAEKRSALRSTVKKTLSPSACADQLAKVARSMMGSKKMIIV